MLSRVANAIYWTFRYLERAENVSRMVYVNLHNDLESSFENIGDWLSIIKASGDEEAYYKKYKSATNESILKFLVLEKSNPNSIFSCVLLARENARTIREIISSKMWEDINQMYWFVKESKKKKYPLKHIDDFLKSIQDSYMSLLGATESTMSHDEAWHFSRLGRMVERGDKTGRILDVKYFVIGNQNDPKTTEPAYQSLVSKSLLKSASAFEMYRQNYSEITPKKVSRFLVGSTSFPRSLNYCASQILFSIDAICMFNGHPLSGQLREKAKNLLNIVKSEAEKNISDQGLHEFIDEYQTGMNELDSKIFEVFFSTKVKPDIFRSYGTQTQSQSLASSS